MAATPLTQWYQRTIGGPGSDPYASIRTAARDQREDAAQQIRSQAASVQSANPFAVGRQAALATADALRPIGAQQAAAMGARTRELEDMQRAYQLAGQQRADQMLGLGLNVGGTVLGTLTDALGGMGGGQPPQASATQPQPMQPPQAARPAVTTPSQQPAQPQAAMLPPMQAGAPQIAPEQREQAAGVVGAAQRLSPLLSLWPGYGQIAQIGLGALGGRR